MKYSKRTFSYLEPGDYPGKPKKRVLDLLGNGWKIRVIDLEHCVYRDLVDYDIEISGVRTQKSHISIYVWQTSPHLEIIERYLDLPQDDAAIKALCDDIVRRYSHERKDD